jgi:oleandomycin transport system ATP-binding protein
MTSAIQAEGLTKSFGTTKALVGVDLDVPAGTVLGVLGPNGAGKTTAVRVLATLLRPDSGHALVAGHDVVADPTAVRRSIGLTGQYASVDELLTGRENLVLFGRLLGLRRVAAKARGAELLSEFGLDDAADRKVRTYSGGMRRRLDLAASLIGRPEVIFLDEPTTGLDPSKRDEVWGMVRSLTRGGTTVLLTTQYLEEADALADAITVIDAGRVVAHGTPADLKRVVGTRSLQVRPERDEDLPAVAEVLRRAADREPERLGGGMLAVPADDGTLAVVVAELARRGVGVDELALVLPSLDEVFFSLTGARAAAPADSGNLTGTLEVVAP